MLGLDTIASMGPKTQYASNEGVHLAFQTVGEGDLDLLLIDTWVHHVEAVWDIPEDRSEHELRGVPGTWRLYAASMVSVH